MSTIITPYPSAIDQQKWFNRRNKRDNDQSMYDMMFQVLDPTVNHRCMMLPGDTWFFEQKLMERNPLRSWTFEGINGSPIKAQREAMVAVKRLANAKLRSEGKKTRFHTPFGSKQVKLSRLTDKTIHKYSVIYADFCGSWCGENDMSLHNIFGRKLLLDNSILIITSQIKCPRQSEANFNLLRQTVNNNTPVDDPLFSTVGVMGSPNFKTCTTGINTMVHLRGEQAGYTVELVHFNMYKGDKKGHNMLTFGYKINYKK